MTKSELYWLTFCALGVAFSLVEHLRPARRRDVTATLAADVAAFCWFKLVVYPAAVSVTDRLLPHLRYPPSLLALPLAAKVVIAYVVSDFGAYWVHRLMHTRFLWRIHKWHHAPRVLYWLAGARATLPQQILFNLPYLVVIPLFAGAPVWLFAVVLVHSVFQNNFMHMNITWRSNVLEWIIVTPRYHHIHHGVDITTHGGNYGALFTVWDRLFGTYRDPDDGAPAAFGTGSDDTDVAVRVIAGV